MTDSATAGAANADVNLDRASEQLLALFNEPPNRPQRLLLAMAGALCLHALIILGLQFQQRYRPAPQPVYSLNVALLEQAGGDLDTSPSDLAPVLSTSTPATVPETPPANALPPQPAERPRQALVTTANDRATAVALGTVIRSEPEPVAVAPETPLTALVERPASEAPTPTPTLQTTPAPLPPAGALNSPRAAAENDQDSGRLEGFYAESWRLAVEHAASRNLPAKVAEQALTGRLTLEVSIRADGSVAGITMLRSSGNPVLDRAARQIVYLAAPFEPFPPALRRQRDVIHIVRTWEFDRGNRLRASTR